MAGGLGENRDGRAQTVVAGAPKDGRPALSRLDRHRAHAGIGARRLAGGVALARIAHLGRRGGRGDGALGIDEQAEEDPPVGVGAHGAGDRARELRDLGHQARQGAHQPEHDPAPGLGLGGADHRPGAARRRSTKDAGLWRPRQELRARKAAIRAGPGPAASAGPG